MNIKKIFGRTAVAASLAVMAAVPQAASAGSTGGTDCTALTGSDRHMMWYGNIWNAWSEWDAWAGCDGWESDSDSYPSYPWIDTGEDGGGTDSGFGAVSSYAFEVADIVNQERMSQGLFPLSYDSQLAELAQKKAEDMAENGYFSHQSSTYGSAFDMMNEAGISYRSAGENIARGQRTPEAVMDSWMNSSGHRANILSSSYSSVGVGYAEDENGTAYWVQMFLG